MTTAQRHFLYLLGEPGVGKSSTMQALVGDTGYFEYDKPFAHVLYENGVQYLGVPEGEFPGTDRLAMDVGHKVVDWLKEERPVLVMGEGDRLAYSDFFYSVIGMGYKLTLVMLEGKDAAAQRRRERSLRTGKEQNAQWVRGRQTKHGALAGRFEEFTTHINTATFPPEFIAKLIPGVVAEMFR